MSFQPDPPAEAHAKRSKGARRSPRLSATNKKRVSTGSQSEPKPGAHSAHDQHTEKLSDLMTRAAAGDLLAAQEVAGHLSWLVSESNPIPVPDFARDYLSHALGRIGFGDDARDAFHLRKGDGPRGRWTHDDKVLAVGIMQHYIDQGMTGLAASAAAAENIHELAQAAAANEPRERPSGPVLRDQVFARKHAAMTFRRFADPDPIKKPPVSEETLRKWYRELKSRRAPRGKYVTKPS
ncbi:MAG: hypothetical protein ABSH33_18620 [Steroidobacteraceae bacterium]|jgi:hypothetical protein